MFSLISGFWRYCFEKPNVHILIIGLDYAGKTTTLEKIKSKFGNNLHPIPPDRISPTIGMNLAKINYAGTKVIIWDLGGQIKMRNMWEKYYDDANAIIFVVDSSDVSRLEEAKLAYEAILDHESVHDIPVIIFANKQDLPEALTPGDLAINFFSLQDSADRSTIYPISAISGDGIVSALTAVIREAKEHAKLILDS